MSQLLKPLELSTPQLAVSRRKRQSRSEEKRRVVEPEVLSPAYQPVSKLKIIPAVHYQTLIARFPWKSYLLYLPVLLTGIAAYCVIGLIFLSVEPRSIQHVWLPNSYAPLMLLSAVAHFAVFSYLLLSTRRGALISAVLTAILFLKLQQVLTQLLALQIIGIGASIEVVYLILEFLLKKTAPHLRKVKHKLPSFPRYQFSTANKSKTLPVSDSEPQPPPKRKHGRQRKHHFFGK